MFSQLPTWISQCAPIGDDWAAVSAVFPYSRMGNCPDWRCGNVHYTGSMATLLPRFELNIGSRHAPHNDVIPKRGYDLDRKPISRGAAFVRWFITLYIAAFFFYGLLHNDVFLSTPMVRIPRLLGAAFLPPCVVWLAFYSFRRRRRLAAGAADAPPDPEQMKELGDPARSKFAQSIDGM